MYKAVVGAVVGAVVEAQDPHKRTTQHTEMCEPTDPERATALKPQALAEPNHHNPHPNNTMLHNNDVTLGGTG